MTWGKDRVGGSRGHPGEAQRRLLWGGGLGGGSSGAGLPKTFAKRPLPGRATACCPHPPKNAGLLPPPGRAGGRARPPHAPAGQAETRHAPTAVSEGSPFLLLTVGRLRSRTSPGVGHGQAAYAAAGSATSGTGAASAATGPAGPPHSDRPGGRGELRMRRGRRAGGFCREP